MQSEYKCICPECSSSNLIKKTTLFPIYIDIRCVNCGFRGTIKVSVEALPTQEKNDVCRQSRDVFQSSGKAGLLRRAVFEYIKAQGEYGATCNEIEEALKAKHQSVSCTITFLTNPNYGYPLLYKAGKRENPETGNKVTVYRIINDQMRVGA